MPTHCYYPDSPDPADNKNILFNVEDITERISDLGFGNTFKSIELDIGSSHGEFLSRMARDYPFSNFVGVEIVEEKCRIATRRVLSRHLSNARIVNMEASQFISEFVPTLSVNAVHIYFPTPYPCRELGLKHRLVNREFIAQVYRILKDGGVLRIVTDHLGYLNDIDTHLRGDNRWWPVPWNAPTRSIPNGCVVGTHWELKLKEEKNIYKLQLIK
jgi:tRNA (guanine-N7-)-methyltransferase